MNYYTNPDDILSLIDDDTKIKLKNAATIVDKYYGTGSRELGIAYLVAIPAFNFDQIPSTEDSEDEDSEDMGDFVAKKDDSKKVRRSLVLFFFMSAAVLL